MLRGEIELTILVAAITILIIIVTWKLQHSVIVHQNTVLMIKVIEFSHYLQL